MENPPMLELISIYIDRVPNVAFHGTFRKGDGAQIGLEPENGTKWCMGCVLLWWLVWGTHRVVGLLCCQEYRLLLLYLPAYLLLPLYERGTPHVQARLEVHVRVGDGCRATGMDRKKGGCRH